MSGMEATNGLLAIIPARGGSKGIPRKNSVLLAGIPLLVYSIKAALSAKCIDQIVVSSDDDGILELCAPYPIQACKRPANLAMDSSSSDAVVDHLIKLYADKLNVKYLMLLQPTSPLRLAEDIDRAWDLFLKQKPQLLLSVYKGSDKLVKAFKKKEDGFLTGLLSPEAPFLPRQVLPEVYLPNGAIYICSLEAFRQSKGFPREQILPYIMDEVRSIDIDTIDDLKAAENFLLKAGKNESK